MSGLASLFPRFLMKCADFHARYEIGGLPITPRVGRKHRFFPVRIVKNRWFYQKNNKKLLKINDLASENTQKLETVIY